MHFIFNTGVPSKTTPFARKYAKLLEGTLKEFEDEERERFIGFVEKFENEDLDDNEKNPIVYEDIPYFTLELTSLNRIAFSIADDPFYKSLRGKYYPELIVTNIKGKIMARINPENPKSDKYGLEYLDDFREPNLKLNDDKKVRIVLSQMKKPGTMILMTVKTFDLRKNPPKDGEFDRAWYRLTNEDTNQTLDYKKIKEIEKPEGFDEDAPLAEEENEDPAAKPFITYVAGRIFMDTNGRWVYESYNHSFTSDKYPDLVENLVDMYKRSEEEVRY